MHFTLIFLLSGVLAGQVALPLWVSTAMVVWQADESTGRVFDAAVVEPNAGMSQAELQRLAAQAASNAGGAGSVPAPDADVLQKGSINFLNLLLEGGILMVPIALISLLVVAVSFERVFALRRGRIYPRNLRREVKRSVDSPQQITPQALYEVAVRHASPAGRVMEDVLQKVGRPVPELEATIGEGVQREAERMHGNVRWLTLAAAVAPLIGLLGTVWGMIIAFYNTTQLGAGGNKAEFLAEGIYVALVTTLGGLAVAIPAAIFAHYFEGKITRTLGEVEASYRRLVPRFEGLEGTSRFDVTSQGLVRRQSPSPDLGGGSTSQAGESSRDVPPSKQGLVQNRRTTV